MYAVVTGTSSEPSQQANVADLDRELQAFLDQQPGCRGYLMIDKDDGGHVSIVLCESKEIWDTAIHTEKHDHLLARMRPLLTSRPAIYRGTPTASEFKTVCSTADEFQGEFLRRDTDADGNVVLSREGFVEGSRIRPTNPVVAHS